MSSMVTFSQVLTVNFFWDTNIIFISVASRLRRCPRKWIQHNFFCRWTFCSAAFSRFNVLLGLCLAYLHGWVQNWKPGRQFREIRGPPPHPLLLPIYALLLCLPGWISSAGQWPFYLGNLKGSFNACRTRGGTSPCWWRCDKERYQGIPSIWSKFALSTRAPAAIDIPGRHDHARWGNFYVRLTLSYWAPIWVYLSQPLSCRSSVQHIRSVIGIN